MKTFRIHYTYSCSVYYGKMPCATVNARSAEAALKAFKKVHPHADIFMMLEVEN